MTRRFTYRLDALLALRRRDLDIALAHERESLAAHRQRESELARLHLDLAQLQEQAHAVAAPGAALEPSVIAMTRACIAERHTAVQRGASELRDAERMLAQARERRMRARQQLLGLEKHRAARAEEHAREVSRIEQLHADDAWLQRVDHERFHL